MRGLRVRHVGHGRDRAASDAHTSDPVVWAAYPVTSHTPGLSAHELQRQLGIAGYETAWVMLNKLRRAMVGPDRAPLHTEVEVNEAYIGGPEAGLRGRPGP